MVVGLNGLGGLGPEDGAPLAESKAVWARSVNATCGDRGIVVHTCTQLHHASNCKPWLDRAVCANHMQHMRPGKRVCTADDRVWEDEAVQLDLPSEGSSARRARGVSAYS